MGESDGMASQQKPIFLISPTTFLKGKKKKTVIPGSGRRGVNRLDCGSDHQLSVCFGCPAFWKYFNNPLMIINAEGPKLAKTNHRGKTKQKSSPKYIIFTPGNFLGNPDPDLSENKRRSMVPGQRIARIGGFAYPYSPLSRRLCTKPKV